MKRTILLAIILALYTASGFIPLSGQKTESIIHNPAEPLHGEITFELEENLVLGSESEDNYIFYRVWDIQADAHRNIYVLDSGAHRIQKYDKNGKYLQTIGRQGQGPGEFGQPIMLAFDKNSNLYVAEMAKIHMFDTRAKFVKTTSVPFFFMNFSPDGERNFFVTGRITIEGAQNLGVMKLDSDGKICHKIAEFPGLLMHKSGTTISHDYSPQLRFAAMPESGFVYGYNMDYTLYMADLSGKNVIVFDKEEPSQIVSRKEKNKIIEDLFKKVANAELGWTKNFVEKMANLPHHRPFFDRIRVDDRGRIYVRRCKSVLDDSEEMNFDIFGNDGHYLYTTRLPFLPMSIRDGFMYHAVYTQETGEVKVIRYKINNWDGMLSALD
jgi:hypothetical protein